MLNPEWKNNNQLLIEEFRSGNKNAFHCIHDRYYATLCSFAYNLIGDLGEAQDIVSESFIKLWERHYSFETVVHARSFLFTVTRNACFDFLKAIQRKEESHKQIFYLTEQEEESHLNASMVRAELYNIMLEEIENMPAGMKQIIKLILEGKSTADIAQKLNISEETVRGQKARAVKFLKKTFKDRGATGVVLSAALTLLKLVLYS